MMSAATVFSLGKMPSLPGFLQASSICFISSTYAISHPETWQFRRGKKQKRNVVAQCQLLTNKKR
jgi:hypothetical protein